MVKNPLLTMRAESVEGIGIVADRTMPLALDESMTDDKGLGRMTKAFVDCKGFG